MTPTLYGRWQTRFLLLGTAGLLVSLLFGLARGQLMPPLVLLGYVLVLGLGWDILYDYLQTFRWERDWAPIYQLAVGIAQRHPLLAMAGV